MAGFLGFHYPRLRFPYGASDEAIEAVKQAARTHRGTSEKEEEQEVDFFAQELGATEQDPSLHLLWRHCMNSQILPESLKRLRRRELEFIAAHSGDVLYLRETADSKGSDRTEESGTSEETEQPPSVEGEEPAPSATKQRVLIPGRNEKLQENAVRAGLELQRRDRRNGSWATSIAAAIGAAAGTWAVNWLIDLLA